MNHNRRQFIGQCATMVKTSAVSAMIGRMPAATSPDQPLLNWAGNYQVQHTAHYFCDLAGGGPGVRQKTRAAQGSRHPPLLQRDC